MNRNSSNSTIILCLSVLCLSLTATGCGSRTAESGYPVESWERSVRKEMRRSNLEGLTVSVVSREGGAWSAGFGIAAPGIPLTASTPMQLASVTKTFTSLAVMKLVEEGKVDLNAPIGEYVHEMKGVSYPGAAALTVLDILTHHGGLSSDLLSGQIYTGAAEDFPTAFMADGAIIANEPLTEEPGLLAHYSNNGYTLLGILVARVSGVPYHSYVRNEILDPLDMRDSGFFYPGSDDGLAKGFVDDELVPAPAMPSIPAGGLWSSAEDLTKYMGLLTSGGLSPTLKTMMSPAYHEVPMDFDYQRGTGFHLMPLPGRPTVRIAYHDGGTSPFASTLIVAPEYGVAVALVSNTDENVPYDLAYELMNDVLDISDNKNDAPARERLSEYTFGPLAGRALETGEMEGYYASEIGMLEVSLSGDKASLDMMGMRFRMIEEYDGIYRLRMNLLGVIPIPIPGVRILFREIDGRKMAAYYESGKFRSIALAVEPTPPHQAWLERTGTWDLVNPGPEPFVEEMSLRIDEENGFMMLDVKVAVIPEPLSLAVRADDPERLVIAGLGRHMGEELRISGDGDDEQLHWAGLVLKRR